jgi:hypothetical protein
MCVASKTWCVKRAIAFGSLIREQQQSESLDDIERPRRPADSMLTAAALIGCIRLHLLPVAASRTPFHSGGGGPSEKKCAGPLLMGGRWDGE